MLADEIEIDTCRLDRKGMPGERLRVRIPGSSGLFRIQKLGRGLQSGTKIRIYLNRKNYKGEPISCLNTLNKLLWVVEHKTEVYQNGIYEVWNPGKISDRNLKEYQYLEVKDSQLWWIANPNKFQIKEAGCILVDGIFTTNTQSCFAINLTREHYPKLTVDRKEIVEWDQEWVYQALISSLEELTSWPEINFPWIWGLSQQWPKVAGQLHRLLEDKDMDIRLSKWSNDTSKISISKVGCFSGDSYLLRYGLNGGGFYGGVPRYLLPLSRLSLAYLQQSCSA